MAFEWHMPPSILATASMFAKMYIEHYGGVNYTMTFINGKPFVKGHKSTATQWNSSVMMMTTMTAKKLNYQ